MCLCKHDHRSPRSPSFTYFCGDALRINFATPNSDIFRHSCSIPRLLLEPNLYNPNPLCPTISRHRNFVSDPERMPSIPLHPRPSASRDDTHNSLPQLLQTPSGLALLELQGTINVPNQDDSQSADESSNSPNKNDPSLAYETPVGKLMFPDYSPQNAKDDTRWMKRAYLYVGRYQRMTGEVKKLPQPLAIIQRRQPEGLDNAGEQLEIVEIVKYKLMFRNRPEPVNDA